MPRHALCAAAALFGWCAIAQDIYEPNDTPEQAALIELNELQRFHSIEPAGDVDFVTFTLDETMPVLVEATDSIGSTRSSIPVLLSVDGSEQLTAPVLTTLAAGSHLAQMQVSTLSTGDGTLPYYAVHLRDATLPDRFEPDSRTAAQGVIQRSGMGSAARCDFTGGGNPRSGESATGCLRAWLIPPNLGRLRQPDAPNQTSQQ